MNGEDLARWRRELGYSQMELAYVLRVTQTTISRWESGASIGNPVILELAMLRLLDMKRVRINRVLADADGCDG